MGCSVDSALISSGALFLMRMSSVSFKAGYIVQSLPHERNNGERGV